MAELSATAALALVQADLPDRPTLLKHIPDEVFRDFTGQASHKDRPAVVGARALRHQLGLAVAVRRKRLVLGKVHPQRHTLDQGACKISCLVNCLCVVELDMTEMTIAQLVHLQADHLYLAAGLEKIYDILLSGVDGEIPQPKRVAVRRLHTLGLASQYPAWRIGLYLRVGHHLVHVGIVQLDPSPHELFTLLLHSEVHARGVLELEVRKIATDLVIADAHLRDSTAVFEQIYEILFLGPVLKPAYPDGSAAIWLGLPHRPPSPGCLKASPKATSAPAARAWPAARAAAAGPAASSRTARALAAAAAPPRTPAAAAPPRTAGASAASGSGMSPTPPGLAAGRCAPRRWAPSSSTP